MQNHSPEKEDSILIPGRLVVTSRNIVALNDGSLRSETNLYANFLDDGLIIYYNDSSAMGLEMVPLKK